MRERVKDVLLVKAFVLWALALVACFVWLMEHPHMTLGLVIAACLTTTAAVWLRIDGANDAWRDGYKTALKDASQQEANVRHLRR
jgi:uncharacterized membrane protein